MNVHRQTTNKIVISVAAIMEHLDIPANAEVEFFALGRSDSNAGSVGSYHPDDDHLAFFWSEDESDDV